MKKISLIGSTGSIGRQVLKVVERHPDKFKIVGLVAGANEELFSEQVNRFKPGYSALASSNSEKAYEIAGLDEADIIFNAAGGFAGLKYSLKAIEAGKTLALANKETLVCGGNFVTELANRRNTRIIPVDSEHSAIWQCLNYNARTPFKRLIITASGGAFKGKSFESLKSVTPEEALCHPTWNMGKKITVDSATLMNKGYEVIEAHVLYNAPFDKITAVIQPQSIVHSMVEFEDGAVLAQMSYPTMEIPIQLALSYPERLDTELKPLDFDIPFSIGFERLDPEKYPLFKLASECGRAGGVVPCAMNAADEEAVYAFLRGEIAFTDIYGAVSYAVEGVSGDIHSLEALERVDKLARERAKKYISDIK